MPRRRRLVFPIYTAFVFVVGQRDHFRVHGVHLAHEKGAGDYTEAEREHQPVEGRSAMIVIEKRIQWFTSTGLRDRIPKCGRP
jgi:hypothetical protein